MTPTEEEIQIVTDKPARERDLFDYTKFPLERRTENGETVAYRRAYGRLLPHANDVQIELWAAARRLTPDQGGLGELAHYRNALQLAYPYLKTEWHHWLDMQLETFTGAPSTNTWLSGGGIGKAQPLDSLVRTPNGWRKIGDLKIGDAVTTPNGETAQIIQVHPQGKIATYKVSFSDGTSTLCCANHLWNTSTRNSRRNPKLPTYSVKTTKEIAESLFFGSKRRPRQPNHRIQITHPVYGEHRNLPIDPYLLGLLISNGSLTKSANICIDAKDEDIKTDVLENHEATLYSTPAKEGSFTIGLPNLMAALSELGLRGKRSWEKFIPQEYLTASVQQRTQLLQGLNDGDGSPCESGRNIEYSTSSKQLSEQYQDLAESLGCVCNTITKESPTFSYLGEKKIGRPSYRTFAKPPLTLSPFKGKRKLQKLKDDPKLSPSRSIINVEYFDDLESQCITIDSQDQLYLTNNYIVTHNSWFTGTFSRFWYAAASDRRGVLIINTTAKTQEERAWGYTLKADLDFPWLAGQVVGDKSKPKIGLLKKDSAGRITPIPQIGIISQTVKAGSNAKATADLKGLHPKELIVIVEESNHLKATAIQRARGNWIRNQWYKIVLLGNPEIDDTVEADSADTLYFFSQPESGWDTIKWGVDRSWRNQFGGTTYHFDLYDSPGLVTPDKFKVSHWIPTEAIIRQITEELGGENSALFKQQGRGIYDHASLPYNPITVSMCEKFKAGESANFTGVARQRWAAFDPAFGGNDEAFLKIAETGLASEGIIQLDLLGAKTNFVFKIDADSAEDPSFQMLAWIKEKLAEWEVPAHNFIMDANLIGNGLGDIFARFISPRINRVKATGQASTEIVFSNSKTDKDIKANQLYANRITELWMGVQKLLINNQIRGLDNSIRDQLVLMPAEKINGREKVLEKKEFRKKFGFSPDRAEAVIYLTSLIIERGLQAPPPTTIEEQTIQMGLHESPWLQNGYSSHGNGIIISAMPAPFGAQQEEQVSWASVYDKAMKLSF